MPMDWTDKPKAMKPAKPQRPAPARLPPGKPWTLRPGQKRLHHAVPAPAQGAEPVREYQPFGPGVVIVVAPFTFVNVRTHTRGTRHQWAPSPAWTPATLGWRVSLERRSGTRAGRVLAIACDSMEQVVGVVSRLAALLMRRPPGVLRVVLADELDVRVAGFIARTVTAAMAQADGHALPLTA